MGGILAGIPILFGIYFIAGNFFYSRFGASSGESLGAKKEWAILQALEFKHRDSALSGPTMFETNGYRIACISADKGEKIFILLNPQFSPFYKQLPEADYSLSPDHFIKVLQEGHPISTVREAMKSHINEK